MSPLDYAARGVAVFPCHYPVINGAARCSCGNVNCSSPAKHPYQRHAPHGFKSASTFPPVIQQWCSEPYNVAIATGAVSGVIVVDIDPRNGGDESLVQLEAEHGTLPLTWRVLTGGGGEHIYFAHPGGHVACSIFAPGIELKGDGGYVVAPQSRHISGRHYEWNVDHHPEEIPLAPAPQWVVERGRPRARVPPSGRTDWKVFAVARVDEGSRHNAIIHLCGLLFRRMAREAHLAASLIYSFNQTHCNPPLDELEVRRMIEWAAAAERDRQTGAAR
jgi:putative DNA primase/helicase